MRLVISMHGLNIKFVLLLMIQQKKDGCSDMASCSLEFAESYRNFIEEVL